jgi:hypothetical protein
MTYRIAGLDPQLFTPLFALDAAALAARGILRRTVDARPGYPCCVSLAHAEVGEDVLLLPYEHLATDSPYRASGPIYVRRGVARFDAIDALPEVLRLARALSVRGYDAAALMIAAEVVGPAQIEASIVAMLANPAIARVQIHNAGPGCFACQVVRA